MKKTINSYKTRFAAACLAAVILCGSLPMTAFAEETTDLADNAPVVMSEESIAGEPVVESAIVEEPVVEAPVVEEPIVEEPVVEAPVVEEPTVEEPVVEEPVLMSEEAVNQPSPTSYAMTRAASVPNYIVVYNSVDASTTPTSDSYINQYNDVPENGSLNIPDPSKDGYIFKGWTVTVTDRTTHQAKTVVDGAKGLTLDAAELHNTYNGDQFVTCTANWEEIPAAPTTYTYQIRYSGLEDATPSQTDYETNYGTIDSDKTLTIPDPTKPGYTFVGWNYTFNVNLHKGITLNGSDIEAQLGDGGIADFVELKAVWEQIITAPNYIVTYQNVDESTTPTFATYINLYNDVPAGGSLNIPDPSKPGSTFLGWTVTVNDRTTGQAKTIMNGAKGLTLDSTALHTIYNGDHFVDLTASWEEDLPAVFTYRVLYENLDDTAPAKTDYETNYGTIDSDKTLTIPDPARAGYTFTGWAYSLDTGYPNSTLHTGMILSGSDVAGFLAQGGIADYVILRANWEVTPVVPPVVPNIVTPTATPAPTEVPSEEPAPTPANEVVPVVAPVPVPVIPAAAPIASVNVPSAVPVATPEPAREVTVTPVADENIAEDAIPEAAPETIADEEAPLTEPLTGSWSLVALLLTIATCFAGIWMLLSTHKEYDDEAESSQHRTLMNRMAAVLLALLGILAFLMLQNIAAPMVLFNRDTIISLAVFALQAVNGMLGHKQNETAEEQ